jgi:S-adenosylmethionine:tRNA ribosyltransferase-isomerase
MFLSEFDYILPEELIAGEPMEVRSASRLLVVQRATGTLTDKTFTEFAALLQGGDVLVLNNTRVFPARLFGRAETGANIEIFLMNKVADDVWRALARPAKRLKPGRRIEFSDRLSATVWERSEGGGVVLSFTAEGDFDEIIDETGKTPLPPYIKRDQGALDQDRDRYQTVYAKQRGAIAAPTAGLHFTPEILNAVKQKGVSIAELTLHVGYGTFEPVRVEDLDGHNVLPEQFEMPPETAEQLNAAKKEGRRIIAVGTTTTRALETNFSRHGRFKGENSFADLTIRPGDEFNAIDGLLTNFHLPKSSLLVLVSTFGGHELIMKAYRHAVESRYRFYSYGDCMFIE